MKIENTSGLYSSYKRSASLPLLKGLFLIISIYLDTNCVQYIICGILSAFLLVLSYDLLEDRRIDDIIIDNFFLSII